MISKIASLLVIVVAISLIGYFLNPVCSSPRTIELSEPGQVGSRYFVFADPNNVVDFPPYGNADTIGVAKPVVDMFPTGGNTFATIGSVKTARETFATQNGRSFHPNAKWRVLIHNSGNINGQKRIAVAAFHGQDIAAG